MHNYKQRTMSLPKLKTPRITDQIHKVKWSIAPKCLLPGHQGKEILYICMYPQCKLPSRLVCQECFTKDHQSHQSCLMTVEQVKKADIQKLKLWPFEEKYKKIFDFIVKHEEYVSNLIQDVNTTFNNLTKRIMNEIQKIRQNLIKKIDAFYMKETTKQKFTQKLKTNLEDCFEIKKISEIVRQLFCKQIRHQVFLQKMTKILDNQQIKKQKQNLLKYFQNQEKGSDMFFDKLHFLKKEAWIIQQVDEQKKTIKEQPIEFEETFMGIDRLMIQTIDYINKNVPDKNMLPLSFDREELLDGSVYIGFFREGEKSLFGKKTYRNGFEYYGQWRNNLRNGWGVYENKAKGYKYAGQWKNDRKEGYGRQTTLTAIYDGNFAADKKQGFGVLIQDGNRWQIDWRKDKKHGPGRLIDKDGNIKQIYYCNGVESVLKVKKPSPAFDIKLLTKRFNSVKSTEITNND